MEYNRTSSTAIQAKLGQEASTMLTGGYRPRKRRSPEAPP
jgi:hypothetical protein